MEKIFYSKQLFTNNFLRNSNRVLLNVFLAFLCIISTSNIFGQTGRSLNFDGTNDRVDLPFVVAGSYTKEAWVFATSSAQDNNIVSGASTALWVPTATGKLTAGHSGSFNQVQDPATFAINVWTHVAVTFDASTSSLRLYKNGIAVDSAIGTVPAYTETALYIGAFAAANNFKGSIDEVRIWNIVRTGAQISGNMNCNLTGDEPGLLAYYNFNQGTGGGANPAVTTLTDLSDRCIPNSGTLVNFALTGATSNWVVANPGVNTACSAPSPNINVTGNATCIPIGSTVPSLTNFTDFGDYGVNPLVRTFTIQNTGNANLTISSITITGPGASNFSITTAAGTTIAGGSSTMLGITFNPSAPIAAKNATVTITNNDADEGNFTFSITGFNRGPGRALDFDGTNDLITLPNLLSGSYTKEAWVYSYNAAVENNIVSGNTTAFWAPNSKGFKLTAGHGPTFDQVQDPTPLVANTWTHVAVTYDATGGVGNMKLYKNGSFIISSAATVPTFTETTQYIGAFQGGNLWNGKMNEVRIWNVVRTAAQIAAAKDSILTGDEPGLIGYYRLNGGIGSSNNTAITTVNDLSDKCVANNGTLSGFALNGATSNFVNDSSATFTGKTSTILYPNIAISGNANCITTGDITPSATDFTDFGSYGGSTVIRTFSLTNTGSSTLTVGAVTFTGTNPSSFSITSAPASSVVAGGTTNFNIGYSPTVTGTSNAVVNVVNSDPDEAPYTFAISGNSVVLPVEMVYFRGEKTNEQVKLSWQTATELNNKGFEIQRSADGTNNWQSIGFVAAAGNTGLASTYYFTDRLPLSGINAYRLKQIDLDGNYKLSQIVILNFTGKGGAISFYPNPAKNSIALQFNDNKLLNTNAQINTVTGRTVQTITLTNNRQTIDLNKLPSGIYLISFANGEVKRLVKQ